MGGELIPTLAGPFEAGILMPLAPEGCQSSGMYSNFNQHIPPSTNYWTAEASDQQ